MLDPKKLEAAVKKYCKDVPYGEGDSPYEVCFRAGARYAKAELRGEIETYRRILDSILRSPVGSGRAFIDKLCIIGLDEKRKQ